MSYTAKMMAETIMAHFNLWIGENLPEFEQARTYVETYLTDISMQRIDEIAYCLWKMKRNEFLRGI